jgi:hypothetical protein
MGAIIVNANDDRYLEACLPPWQRFPLMTADEVLQHLDLERAPVAAHAEADSWFDQVWRPFWAALDWEQRERYLLRWRASLRWRSALGLLNAGAHRNAVADAAALEASKQHLASWRERTRQKKPALWHRTRGRR